MKRLKLNTLSAVWGIIEAVIFAVSWFVIIGDAFGDAVNKTHNTSGAGGFFYTVAWISVVLFIVCAIQSKRYGISLVGPVLGIIGSALFGVTAAMAFPAIVVLIVGIVFLFLQHPSKSYQPTNSTITK
ncbi:transporter [Oenococcus sp.]|uniref:transporter n=1 Tax=Oenococcus sp. TaxID=1979414 RepID=UPI0039E827DC